MDKSNRKKNLNSEDLKKYLSGSAQNRHEVERNMLDDNFANDALEGFEKLKSDKIDENAALTELRNRLNNRVLDKKRAPFFTWQRIGLAASIILILGATIFVFKNKEPQEIAKESSPITSPKDSNISNENLAVVLPPQKKNKEESKIFSKNTTNEPPPISDFEVEKYISQSPIEAVSDSVNAPLILAKSTINVTGQILDAENNPIPGVNILIKNQPAASSDSNGEFNLKSVSKDDLIQLSAVGYETKELKLKENDLGKIKLEESQDALAEVIVTPNKPSVKKSAPTQTQINQEPKPQIGWDNYDNYLLNSVKQTGSVSTINSSGKISFRATIEPTGDITNIKLDANDLNKQQVEVLTKSIKNGSKWIPARKKGKKIRKEIKREIKIEN